jgi:predicted RNA-binding Zn ribbon-like protein
MMDAAIPSPSRFRFIGGRPSIDLTTTLRKRAGRPLDRLRSPADLARWFVAAGLASAEVPATERDLRRARDLREALYRLFTATRTGRPADPADLMVVNDRAATPPPVLRLTQAGDGRVVAVADASTAASLLALVAHDAIDLLTGPLADRVRECEGETCKVLFVDVSRAGHRRWCSMDVCGARSKMAAYRHRRQDNSH